MYLIIFLILSLSLIGGIEIIKRKYNIETGISRRITHIGAALIALVSPYFLSPLIIIISCLGFAALLFVGRSTTLFSSIQAVKRKSFGDVFLPLGEALCASLYLPANLRAFQFGVLIMGVSDAVAGLIGERFGAHTFKVFGNQKSIEGSLVFFISSFIITLFFSPFIGMHLVIIPLLLTITEIIFGYGTDNLVLPVVGAFLITN